MIPIRYYKIELFQIPKVLLSHSFHSFIAEKDVFVFDGIKPEIEITFMQCGTMQKHYPDNSKKEILSGQMNVRMPWEKFTRIYDAGKNHSHTMIFTGYNHIEEVDANEVIQIYQNGLPPKNTIPTSFTLPEVILQTPAKAEAIMRKMSTLFIYGNGGKDLRMFSCLFQLLAELTEISVMQAFQEKNTNGTYSNALYSRRVTEYISQHLSEKITVSDLAALIGISNEYLCRIFKNETGQTLISYINRVKMEAVKELLCTQHLSLKEAGKQVGIENEVYLNRLFKKYIGVTSTEYKQSRLSN